MASKWINAILWTLVSVNLVTLVLGGLITWLAYTIPFRLKQFGLSPEITQMAGFAALLVACLGLCALNYSSYHALNAYGLSCAIFLVLMLFGVLPETWQRALHSPSSDLQQPQQHLPNSSSSVSNLSARSSPASPPGPPQGSLVGSALSASLASAATGSAAGLHARPGGLLLDLIYFALLLLLAGLLSIAFVLASYLRQKQRAAHEGGFDASEDLDEHNHSSGLAATIDETIGQRSFSCSQRNGPRLTGALGSASLDCASPSCTCGLAGPASAPPANGQVAHQRQTTMAFGVAAAAANNNAGQPQRRPRMAGGGGHSRFEGFHVATPGEHWPAHNGLEELDHWPGQAKGRSRQGSRSLASLGAASLAAAAPHEDQLEEEFLAPPPLVPRGIYHTGASSLEDDEEGEDFEPHAGNQARQNRARRCRHRIASRPASSTPFQQANPAHNDNNPQQQFAARPKREIGCRCDLPSPSSIASTLAAKLNHTGNPELLANQQQQQHLLKPHQYYNTMPNSLNLSSVYAIKSAVAMASAQRRALEAAKRKKRSKVSSGGSVMAMTAAAAAALLGGVVDSGLLDHGGGTCEANLDDGMAGLADDHFAETVLGHHHHQPSAGDNCGFDDAGNQHDFTSPGQFARNIHETTSPMDFDQSGLLEFTR